MNLDKLIQQVDRITQDNDFDSTTITDYLNRGMLEIAGGIRRADSSTITQPLPLLFTVGTVSTTDTYKVALPVDYHRDIVFAVDYLGRELTIYDSFIEFMKVYPALNATGMVNALAIKGRDLYYQGIPDTVRVITLHYHRYPVDMVDGNDEPDGLPPNFHNILVDYACKEFFSIIEDGIDGKAINTMKYEQRFQRGLEALEASIAAEAAPFSYFTA